MQFNDVFNFEDHYKEAHSFECSECHQKFSNHHILEIHCDETHSAFFQIMTEKNPLNAHFRCYIPECTNRYMTAEERNEHCKLAHSMTDPRAKLAARKPTRHIDEEIKNLSLGQSQSSSRQIRFGDEQERTFEEKRRIATAKRRLQ
jgi:hypothetical protein